MMRPAVIAAASCVIGNRHPLVKSDTSPSMMKETKGKTEADGANLFVWIATLPMKSPVVKSPCFCDWQFDTEVSLNDAMSDVLRRRAGQ